MRSYKNGATRVLDFLGALVLNGGNPCAGLIASGTVTSGAQFSLSVDTAQGAFIIDGNGDIQVPVPGVYCVRWDGSYACPSTDADVEIAGLIEVYEVDTATALATQWIATRHGTDAASIVNASALGWANITTPGVQKLRVRGNGSPTINTVYSRLLVEYLRANP